MKIAYITAGAAGMFCGSCLHDNALVAALQKLGHDALLVPTYTPIRTDDVDVSQKRVFLGGINVFLQQKWAFFRRTPWFLDRLLDVPALLRWAGRFAVKTQADQLGELTLSMLRGEHGHQKKEIAKLIHWLHHEVRPEVVNLTNVLLSGLVHELKATLPVPILGTLQGDDIFLEALPASYRSQALDLIRQHCRAMDGFLATCNSYADFMADYLHIPRDRIHVVYPGLNLKGHGLAGAQRNGVPFTIGYFARICPEKGLHLLVEAFRILRQETTVPCRLRVAGWLGEQQRSYFQEQQDRLQYWGLADCCEHVEAPDHAAKVHFFQNIDVLSVPTTYREPKGLYVLEALANGVPVVQPAHGSFPELIEMTGGGLLVKPNDPQDLARALRQLLEHPQQRQEMGRQGQEAVRRRFTAGRMAEETLAVYGKYLAGLGVAR